MTPMVLMQHEASSESTNKPTLKWYLDRFVLNPYSIADQYDKLFRNYPSALVTKEVLGRTAGYNDILLLKITKASDFYFRGNDDKYLKSEKKEKKIIFIVHALSVVGLDDLYNLTVENYLKILLSYYMAHLDNFDIFLMPLANPDGYLRNKKMAFWNKNYSPQSECYGVDLDRNFDVAWNHSTKTMSSCHPHYPGPRAFSEPETRAVRDIFHKYSHKMVAYFHVHAGTSTHNIFKGDAVLYPKGYSDVQTDDDKYLDIRGEIDDAMKNNNFRVLSVTVDTIYNWYGKTSGSSVDYAATVYGIPYSMEFVMQLYQDQVQVQLNRLATGNHEELQLFALTEIWSRVIEVIFTNIWKKLEAKDD